MSFLTRAFGGSPTTTATGADTIGRLCDRVKSSTLLEDRRDAVRGLKALSRNFRLELGTQAMDILIHVLETDSSDAEITGYALDTLHNIIAIGGDEDEDALEGSPPKSGNLEEIQLAQQFAEIFMKKQENITLLLSLLEEFDFQVRWPAIKLLTGLLVHQHIEVQHCILVSPMGVSKLMDLLADTREVIRNDALLLMIQLTKGNPNIQKIVAFENAFDRLLEIISEEGLSDGGIVVEDCLLLMLNLLKKNPSNMTFFKEGSFIQRLTPFFDIHSEQHNQNGSWSAQKVSNVHLMLQVVRTLVSPSNPQQATSVCQKLINQCGLLRQLSNILMASGVPADILTETLNTVSEIIRGCKINQDFFAAVSAPSSPPRPALVVLLMSMVNEKQPFPLRCAVLYCFQCFLYKNEVGQEQIISTLLPATADVSTVTAGQLLCSGLFSQDPLSNWCSAVALSHALKDNVNQKEQLLRVQLATGLGNPPVSLLQQCTNILSQPNVKVQTRMGLLVMLSSWLAGCPLAVTHFLANSGNVPFLMAKVGEHAGENEVLIQALCAFLLGLCIQFNDNSNQAFTKENIRNLIFKRVGEEIFKEKLETVAKHEAYTLAAQKPQLRFQSADVMLFDYEFTSLFKSLENSIIKAVEAKDEEEAKKTVEEHDNIVTQYKGIIREQDTELSELREKHATLTKDFAEAERQLGEYAVQIQQLKDQYTLIKAQSNVNSVQEDANSQNTSGEPNDSAASANQEQTQEIERLNQTIEQSKQLQESLTSQIAARDATIEKLKNDLTVSEAKAAVLNQDNNDQRKENLNAVFESRLEEQRKEITELKNQVADSRMLAEKLKAENDDLKTQAAQQNDNSALIAEKASMSTQIASLESRLSKSESEVANLSSTNQMLALEKESLEKELAALKLSQNTTNPETEKELERLRAETAAAKEEEQSAKTQLDDLLVLLTETDEKKAAYKLKLKELGQEISDDEGDDGDEEEDDEENDA